MIVRWHFIMQFRYTVVIAAVLDNCILLPIPIFLMHDAAGDKKCSSAYAWTRVVTSVIVFVPCCNLMMSFCDSLFIHSNFFLKVALVIS